MDQKIKAYELIIDRDKFSLRMSQPVDTDIFIETDFVLDFAGDFSLIGLEIVNLKNVTNFNDILLSNCSDVVKVSYDDESDAFYMKLSELRSVDQKVNKGVIILDKDRNVVGFKIDNIV